MNGSEPQKYSECLMVSCSECSRVSTIMKNLKISENLKFNSRPFQCWNMNFSLYSKIFWRWEIAIYKYSIFETKKAFWIALIKKCIALLVTSLECIVFSELAIFRNSTVNRIFKLWIIEFKTYTQKNIHTQVIKGTENCLLNIIGHVFKQTEVWKVNIFKF